LSDIGRRDGQRRTQSFTRRSWTSDVLREAIARKAWFEQTRAEGGHVLVEQPSDKVREVISV